MGSHQTIKLCSNIVGRVIKRKLHLSNCRPKQCRPSSLLMNLHTRNPSSKSAKPRLEKSRLAYTSSLRFFATLAHSYTSRVACSVSLLNILQTPRSETAYSFIDNIESNLYTVAVNSAGAAEELSTASEYQRKAGRRAACLGLVIIIVIMVVLIAVGHLSPSRPAQHGADVSPRFYRSWWRWLCYY